MFFLPAAASILLDVLFLTLFWLERGEHPVGSTFHQRMFDVVVFTALRLLFLSLFTTLFYRERRLSLRVPLLWECVNLGLIVAKGVAFVVNGAPFHRAWWLLGICAASIAFELVCLAHLRSTAGTLPPQHVFLSSAVGAMATMNLAKTAAIPIDGSDTVGLREPSFTAGGYAEDLEEGSSRGRQHSFDERRRFLANWQEKANNLRSRWASKVDELRDKLRRGTSGGNPGGGAVGVVSGGMFGDGEGAPLLLLARMFAQEESAIEGLEELWSRDPKWTEFFLPQYTLFLLYASFVHSTRLEELLLARCETRVHVAHSLYWFLKSFCLEGAGVTPVGVQAIEQMLHEVVSRGELPARSLCERGWENCNEARRYMEVFDGTAEDALESRYSFEGVFGETPAFIDELVKISFELSSTAKETRTDLLRRRLRGVQAHFLPSRAVYVPLGNRRHRVYRIVVEESFSFSTKDRAPYLVTLEVLDYHAGRSRQRHSNMEDPGYNGGDGNAAHRGASGGGGGGGLMSMLTPSTLGRSLRGMKAELDRTLHTLKRTVSREGNGGPVPGSPGAGEQDDASSRLPMAWFDSPSGGDAGSREGAPPPRLAVIDAASDGSSHEGRARILRRGSSSQGYMPLENRAKARGAHCGRCEPSDSIVGRSASWSSSPLAPGTDEELNGGDAASDNGSCNGGASASDNRRLAEEIPVCSGSAIRSLGISRLKNTVVGTDVSKAGSLNSDIPRGAQEEIATTSSRYPGLSEEHEEAVEDGDGESRAELSSGSGRDGYPDGEASAPQRSFLSSSNLMGMWSVPHERGQEIASPVRGVPAPLWARDLAVKPPKPSKVGGAGGQDDGGRDGDGEGDGDGDGDGDDGTLPRTPASCKKSNGLTSTGLGPFVAVADDAANDAVRTAMIEGREIWRSGSERWGYGLYRGEKEGLGSSMSLGASGNQSRVAAAGATSASKSTEAWQQRSRGESPYPLKRQGYGAAEGMTQAVMDLPRIRPREAAAGGVQLQQHQRLHKPWRSQGYAELERMMPKGRDFSFRTDEYETDRDEDEDDDGDGDAGSAPPKVIFKERWKQKEARLRKSSPLGDAREWRLLPVIVKAKDDLRQEQLASQFFTLAHKILRESALGSRAGLRPYDIVATSHDGGVIEAIPDTVSLDALKKNDPEYKTLSNFFHRHFGPPHTESFQRARRNFVESLAANCIVTYLLQVKDRHNGNILLDAKGRVIHIDFGFMLANSPGGNFKFESAPFKLTAEFVDLMDGPSSSCFKGFREVCVQTFMTLRRKMPRLILLVETSSVGNAHLPCFGGRPDAVVRDLRARFKPEVHDRAAMSYVNKLIDRSMHCWRTSWYDWYQNYTVGIAV